MTRTVTLQLVDQAGERLGELPAFDVADPWWQQSLAVVERARERWGAEVRLLRLVHGTAGPPHPALGALPTYGGTVTYAAELLAADAPLPLEPPYDRPTEPTRDGRRPVWARPGGLAEIVRFADRQLTALGRNRSGPMQQVRCWNLSSILRLPTAGGPVWCKSVPPFFAHEGPALAWLQTIAPPGLVPRILGHDDATATVLIDDVPGADLYDADDATLAAIVERLVDLQWRTRDRVGELLALGAPDWRADALLPAFRRLVSRADVMAELTAAESRALLDVVDRLPDRLAELAGCGFPDTLVHGDCHSGNWRSDGSSLVLIDWGDVGVGHPLLDAAALGNHLTEHGKVSGVMGKLVAAWQERLRGCAPGRALELIAPVSALRQALVYRTILDGIEPAEHVYHRADVGEWLRRAIETAKAPS